MIRWIWGESTPTFRDFVEAARRVRPHDSIVWKRGTVGKRLPYEEDESLNRRTWRAFENAVNAEFTPIRRNHICARYGFDWSEMVQSDHALERRVVEYFGVGAETVSTYNLRELMPSWLPFRSLSNRSIDEVYTLHQKAVGSRFLGDTKDPVTVSGAPSLSHENFASDYLEMDRQRNTLYRGIAGLVSTDPNISRLHPYYSRLTMGIISHLETEHSIRDREIIIPAPGPRDGELDYYKVYEIVSSGGMTAVALVPVSDASTLQPLLVFRCTKQVPSQADAILSMLNDLEENIGESGYIAGKEALAKLVDDPKFHRGGKFDVLSYSQGGGQAALLMGDHWRKVNKFIAFNIVGSPDNLIETLAREVNELPKNEIGPSFFLHRNVCGSDAKLGDWVNKSGKKHIGWGITHPNSRVEIIEWDIDDYPVPSENVYDPVQFDRWMNIHGVRPMDQNRENALKNPFGLPWKYTYKIFRGPTMCSPRLDTYKRDSHLEDIRRKLGYFAYGWVKTGYLIIQFFFRVFGIDFFR